MKMISKKLRLQRQQKDEYSTVSYTLYQACLWPGRGCIFSDTQSENRNAYGGYINLSILWRAWVSV